MSIFDIFSNSKLEAKVEKRVKESLAEEMRNVLMGGKSGYASRFVTDIYKDTVLTPHQEMFMCRKAYDYNSYVKTASDTLTNFIICGDTYFNCSDEKKADLINKIYKETGLKQIYENSAVSDTVNYGNAYIEKLPGVDSKKTIKYKYVETPERIYIDLDPTTGEVKNYILEIPDGYLAKDLKTYNITYYGSGFKKAVRGIEIPKEKLLHIKIGKNTIQNYGRGFVAVIVNDVSINKELDRAVAILGRNKAIQKKLMHLKGASETILTNTAKNISSLSDFQNPMFGYDGDVNLFDLSDTKSVSDIMPLIDYVKRKITIGMSPEFLTHGESSNRATGKEQKLSYQLAISTLRSQIGNCIKEEMVKLLKDHNIEVPDDLEFLHGDFSEFDTEGKTEQALQSYRDGAITLNELRSTLGYPEDKEFGNLYKWQLDNKQIKEETNEQNETFEEFKNRVQHKLKIKNIDLNSIDDNSIETLKEYINPELDDKARKQFNYLLSWYLKGSFKYIWRTVGDDKVRSSHRRRDGKEYYILKALKLEEEFPGWAGNCRCVPEIIKRKKRK